MVGKTIEDIKEQYVAAGFGSRKEDAEYMCESRDDTFMVVEDPTYYDDGCVRFSLVGENVSLMTHELTDIEAFQVKQYLEENGEPEPSVTEQLREQVEGMFRFKDCVSTIGAGAPGHEVVASWGLPATDVDDIFHPDGFEATYVGSSETVSESEYIKELNYSDGDLIVFYQRTD